MNKTLFFFLHPKTISLVELGDNGNAIPLCIADTNQVVCESLEDLKRFQESFLSFYELDCLTRLKASYFVIDAGAPLEIRSQFLLIFKECPSLSFFSMDQAMPLALLGKAAVSASASLDFSYNGQSYRLTPYGETVHVEASDYPVGDACVAIGDEDFFCLARPVAIHAMLTGYEERLKIANRANTQLYKRLQSLENKADTLQTIIEHALLDGYEGQLKSANAEIAELRQKIALLSEEKEKAEAVVVTLEREKLAALEREKEEARKHFLEAWAKGKIVSFGEYEWIVLEQQDSRALLISRDALERRAFDEVSNRWQDAEVRAYLNGEFYNKAFTAEERKKIVETELRTENEAVTRDHIFLLSLDEATRYFATEKARVSRLQGEAHWYWLRSPGSDSTRVAYVNCGGTLFTYGEGVKNGGSLRPALWVGLDC